MNYILKDCQFIIDSEYLTNGTLYAILKDDRTTYSGLTFEEYKKEAQKNCNSEKGFKVVDFDSFDELTGKYHEGLKEPFKEITEDRYDDLLNCLPPMNYRRYKDCTIFFISEAYTADMHTCCIAREGKYYSALRDRKETNEELYSALLKTA